MTRKLHVNIFQSVTKPYPTQAAELPWADIQRLLGARFKADNKTGAKLFNFAQFREGTRRKNENVISIDALVLDFDTGISVEDVRVKLGQFEYIVYTTHSHRPDHPKFRVIIPFSRPAAPSEYVNIWKAMVDVTGCAADRQCRDISHCFYLPSCPPGAEEHALLFTSPGEFLDPARFIPSDSVALKKPPGMQHGFPDGQRTEALTVRAGWCLGPWKMDVDTTTAACLAWNEYNTPPLDEEKIRATVASIAAREASKQVGIAQDAPALPPELENLLSLPRHAYEMQRKAVAKSLALRVSFVDDLYEERNPFQDEDIPGAGRALDLPSPDPWPEPVDGAELLTSIEQGLLRYVVLPDGAAVAVTLWILHAYMIDFVFISPRLVITSPEKRCGKTVLLRVIFHLVPKGLMAANLTSASTFRVIEHCRPTLLIDEADSFLKDNEELRGVINSGHARDGAVIRLVGDNHEPRQFSTFCATVLAAIGNVPNTIEDRALKVAMRRKHAGEKTERLSTEGIEALQILSRKAQRWIDDNRDVLNEADPYVPEELNDRAADNWRPLLTIADLAGGGWGERARGVAGKDQEEESTPSAAIMLLEDCRAAFDRKQVERLSSQDLKIFLGMQESRPWADWYRGSPITSAKVAALLKTFGIKPKVIRMDAEKSVRGYDRSHFEDAWSRYLTHRTSIETVTGVTSL